MDIYGCVRQIRPGKYVATLRDISSGEIQACEHIHQLRSTAIRCAEKMETAFQS